MTRRRYLLLALTLLLLLGGLALVPGVRWPVHGWLRGEAFYRGMPTSWWEREIQECYTPAVDHRWNWYSAPSGEQRLMPGGWHWEREVMPSVWQKVHFQFDRRAYGVYVFGRLNGGGHQPPLTEGDAETLPVLRALLHSGHPKVRLAAVVGLAQLKTPEVAEDLRGALEEEDDDVRAHVLWALAQIERRTDQR